jgi:deoxyxylulose-5-phosphate synthase
VLGTPTRFIPHGDPKRILARLGLDTDGIVRAIRGILDRNAD